MVGGLSASTGRAGRPGRCHTLCHSCGRL